MMVDPRLESAKVQLNKIKSIITILSVKGGVGKSTITVLLSLALREKGLRIGVLDTDFSNPSLHLMYGLNPSEVTIEEENGIMAPQVADNIRLSTPVLFTEGRIIPSRSRDSLNALLELLAITNWADTEILIIDTPPGLRDEQISLLKVLKEIHSGVQKAIIVTTPSRISIENVGKSMMYIDSIYEKEKILLINKSRKNDYSLEVRGYFKCRIVVPWDELLEDNSPIIDDLLKSRAYEALKKQLDSQECIY